MKHSRHPAGAVWDDLSQDQRDDLRDSLADGYDPNRPVLVADDGLVVDGWHRLSLCDDLNITPTTMTVPESDILSTIARRHCDLSTTRRLSPLDRALGIVKAMQACGRDFARPGQRGSANGNAAITIDEVCDLARCGRTSARRAIDNVKGVERPKDTPKQTGSAPDSAPWQGAQDDAPSQQPSHARPAGDTSNDIDHVALLERARDTAEAERDEAHERLALIETQLSGDESEAVEKIQQMAALIETLRGQVGVWQNKYATLKRERDALARKLKNMGG